MNIRLGSSRMGIIITSSLDSSSLNVMQRGAFHPKIQKEDKMLSCQNVTTFVICHHKYNTFVICAFSKASNSSHCAGRVRLQCSDVSQVVTVRNSSWGNVMFLQVSVCSGGKVYTPQKNTPILGRPPPLDSHCSGRYAYYWNAFLFFLILPPATKLGQGYVFTRVCDTVTCPTACWDTPPSPAAVHAGRYGQQAGGTHPTGMQPCYYLPTKLLERNVFSLSNEDSGRGVPCGL